MNYRDRCRRTRYSSDTMRARAINIHGTNGTGGSTTALSIGISSVARDKFLRKIATRKPIRRVRFVRKQKRRRKAATRKEDGQDDAAAFADNPRDVMILLPGEARIEEGGRDGEKPERYIKLSRLYERPAWK